MLARLPDLREGAFAQRPAQVFDPVGPSGAARDADDALDHRDVSVPPQQEFLIQIQEGLKDRVQAVALIEVPVDGSERLRQLIAEHPRLVRVALVSLLIGGVRLLHQPIKHPSNHRFQVRALTARSIHPDAQGKQE